MSERSQNNSTGSGVSQRPRRPAWQAALLSLIIPGAGQWWAGVRTRGIGILLAVAALGGLVAWSGMTILAIPFAALWLWAAWDAYRVASRGRGAGLTLPVLFAAILVYALGASLAEIRPGRLITGWPGMQPYLRAMTKPDLFQYPTEDLAGYTPFQVPCVSPLPPPGREATQQPRVTTSVPCAAVGDTLQISGEGFLPNTQGEVWWISPIGDRQRVIENGQQVTFMTDANGRFQVSIVIPLAVPLTQQPAAGQTQTHLVRIEQHKPYGRPVPTQNLTLVVQKIGETVALAFLATVLGMIFALPISFLAARNLMGGSPVTMAVYYVVRTILNIIRSIESLMWAIVFAVWVGLGPFDGTLALWLHTVAALSKLYSEAIESIDPGPIEALRATGASMPQVVVYAVLPQILPTFASFSLYRWDINVRMSTVIGLVANAGLGFLVIQWVRLNNFRAMATAIMAIVLVIAVLDYVSAFIRQRLIVGTPVVRRDRRSRAVRYAVTGVLLVGFIAAFAWSWSVAEIDPVKFVQGVPDGMRLLRDMLAPRLFERPTQEHTVGVPLPVPCVAGQATPPAVGEDGAQVGLSVACGNVGEPLTISGQGLPPDTAVSVRWTLPDGAFLRVKENCCTTDASGNLRLDTRINALMDTKGEPGQVTITWKEVIGGPRPSAATNTVLTLAVQTLFMALLATTVGALLAIPLSFLAARNIVGTGVLGRAVYNVSRLIFNLWRAVEPMILALICAAWVAAGPFAGTLALAIWTIPNVSKLFSESIEEIDPGPVEAVTATGANRWQTLVYAIAPQLVPRFLAFILYQWDINIRMSTVVGFVGGGGIGYWWRQEVQLNQYAEAAVGMWAIVVMVWSMDYLSAKAREKLV